MELAEIKKLALLARLELSPEEEQKYLASLESILGYISQIKDAKVSDREADVGEIYNIFREDTESYTREEFTERLLKEAPETQDGFYKVKKIL